MFGLIHRRKARYLVGGMQAARALADCPNVPGGPAYWAAVARDLEADLGALVARYPQLLSFDGER